MTHVEWITNLKESHRKGLEAQQISNALRLRDDNVLLAKIPDVWSALTSQLRSDIAEISDQCILMGQTDTRIEFRNKKLPYRIIRVSLRTESRTLRIIHTCSDGINECNAGVENVQMAIQPGDYVTLGVYVSVQHLCRHLMDEVLRDCEDMHGGLENSWMGR